jgi:5-methylcytosine-specific restriction endonuclease McrA
MPEVMKRDRRGNPLGTKTITRLMPTAVKAKKRLVSPWHNPSTAKEEMIRENLLALDLLWIGYEDRQGWKDLRDEVIARKGTTCAIQGPDCESQGKALHPSEVEMDHIIPRGRFKNPQAADRMKHLQPGGTSCHRAKTKSDLKVLSRMR